MNDHPFIFPSGCDTRLISGHDKPLYIEARTWIIYTSSPFALSEVDAMIPRLNICQEGAETLIIFDGTRKAMDSLYTHVTERATFAEICVSCDDIKKVRRPNHRPPK